MGGRHDRPKVVCAPDRDLARVRGTVLRPPSAVSSFGGFRTPAAEYAAPSLKRPASETLHTRRHSQRNKTQCYRSPRRRRQFSFFGDVNFVARSSSPNIALFLHNRSMSRGLRRLRVCLSRRRIYLERSPTREPRRISRRIL